MAQRNSSQSPRAGRSSTENALAHAKGDVQINQNAARKDGGPENARVWENQGKSISKTWKPDV